MGFIYTYYRILIIKCIEFCSRNKLKTKSGFQYLFSGCFVVVTGRFDDCRYRPWGHFGLLDPRRPPKILIGFGNSERPKCKRLSHLRRHSIARADQNSQPCRIRKKRIWIEAIILEFNLLRQRTVRRYSSRNLFILIWWLKSQLSKFKCTKMIAHCTKSVNKRKALSQN